MGLGQLKGFDVLLSGDGVARGRLKSGGRLVRARVSQVGACVRVEVEDQGPQQPGPGLGQTAALSYLEERLGVDAADRVVADSFRRCA